MRQPFINIYFLCILTFFPNFFSGDLAAQSEKSSPLAKCWQIDVRNINKTQIASDNAEKLFYSHDDGLITSINVSDGLQNWKTELGGQVLDSLYDEQTLYVISANSVGTEKKASAGEVLRQSGTSQNLMTRAISTQTGIVKWQTPLEIVASGDFRAYIVPDSDYLYIASAPGVITKLSKNEGRVLENSAIRESLSTRPLLSLRRIIFGTQNNNIYILSTEKGQMRKIAVENTPTSVVVAGEKIIVGDTVGKLSAYDSLEGKRLWQTRMGAGVSNITKIENPDEEYLAVSSNDNFIYLISVDDGEKIWKKRLTGRTTTVEFPLTKSLLSVEINGTSAVFIELEKGITNNRLLLESPDFFVNKPLILGDFVVFHTKDGLLGYSSRGCAKVREPTAKPAL